MSERVTRVFPDLETVDGRLQKLCETIINCIVLAKEKGKELMSVVASSESLSDLDHIVLPVIFAARSKTLSQLARRGFNLTAYEEKLLKVPFWPFQMFCRSKSATTFFSP